MDANNTETHNSLNEGALSALSEQLAEAVGRVSPAVVAVDARPRVRTSGVVWRPGVVVSTNHTVRRDEDIIVTTHDGREVKATLAGRDAGTDLCVLRLEGDEGAEATVGAAKFADASTLKVGHLALAVGRAHPERGASASLGIVGVLGDKWRTWRGGEIDRLIRPDVSIFIGFSGGALVNTEGHVVGVNTTGLARGAGVTVPASTVERVVGELLTRGRVARPYLGVGMYHPVVLSARLREKFNLPQTRGLLMFSVEPDGPADKAGVIIGDILLALGDAAVEDLGDAQAALSAAEVGSAVRAKLLRGGELKEVEITLGERPRRKRHAE